MTPSPRPKRINRWHHYVVSGSRHGYVHLRKISLCPSMATLAIPELRGWIFWSQVTLLSDHIMLSLSWRRPPLVVPNSWGGPGSLPFRSIYNIQIQYIERKIIVFLECTSYSRVHHPTNVGRNQNQKRFLLFPREFTLHMLVNFVLCFVLYADTESRSKFNLRHNGDSMPYDASVNPS